MQNVSVSNAVIADKLREMGQQPDKNQFQKKNYMKAANNIRKSSVPITSGKQARSLFSGIGDSIQAKIDEIIATGSLEVLESRSPEELEKIKTLELFKSIYGVGEKQAEKWYDMGLRTLEQLMGVYYSMTDAQKLGYQHYNDINLKIPRQEITWVNEYFNYVFTPRGVKFVITGSYRRGLLESSDIDVLVQRYRSTEPNNLTLAQIVGMLNAPGFIVANLALGDTTYRGLVRLAQTMPVRRLDIRLVDEKAWPFAILYFTGSKDFNIALRNRAISLGYSLSEYTLTESATGKEVPAQTEQDIFAALGVKYLEPHERIDNIKLEFLGGVGSSTVETGKWYRPAQNFYMYIGDRVNSLLTPNTPIRVAGFDLDDTIITTIDGGFRKSADDIVLIPSRVEALKAAIAQGYLVVIFTNQFSRSEAELQLNYSRIVNVLGILNLPVILCMATAKDNFRKPETGMWTYIESVYPGIDRKSSFYVGDAAGRPGDHSDSDLKFAQALGIQFFT